MGQQIRALRFRAGMTQHDLAKAAGIHRNTVADYERGRYQPSAAHYKLLREAIGLGDVKVIDEAITSPRRVRKSKAAQ